MSRAHEKDQRTHVAFHSGVYMKPVLLLIGYVLAIAYGSLLPFNFVSRSLLDATAFLSQSLPGPGIFLNNPDLGLNVALYMPLGFLIVMALAIGRDEVLCGTYTKIARLLLVFTACTIALATSIAIEIAQAYTVSRRADIVDVFANGFGAMSGALLAAIFLQAGLRSVAAFRAGGISMLRPLAALGIVGFIATSFFPFAVVQGTEQLRTKVEAGQIGIFLAPAFCDGTATCAGRLFLEVLSGTVLALLLAGSTSLKASRAAWATAGACIGLSIEFVQLFLSSGVAQGASIAARGIGFLLAGWLLNSQGALRIAALRLREPAFSWGAFAVAFAAILFVNRIQPPFVFLSQSLTDALSEVRWLPFMYLFEVPEARIAQSIAAQFAAYSLLGFAFGLAFSSRGRPSAAYAVIAALVVSTLVEGIKLLMPERHPDPSDILVGVLACGLSFAVLRRVFAPTSHPSTQFAKHDGEATSKSVDATRLCSTARPERLPVARDCLGQPSRMVQLGASLLFAIAVLSAAWLPRYGIAAAFLVIAVALAVSFQRHAWLILLPWLLPSVDLAPWTGRFFWTEFDSMCAAILAVLWWKYGLTAGRSWARMPAGLTAIGLGLWTIAGTAISGFPFPVPQRTDFDSYFSPFVGFYSIKGLGWALLFYPFAVRAFAEDQGRAKSFFGAGMTAGLATTTAFILWERHTFPGLFNLAHEYRVTGPFSAMHTGGAYIEGYMIGALPFVALFALRFGHTLLGLASAAFLTIATYALLVTHSRGAYLGLALATVAFVAPLTLSALRARRGTWAGIGAGVVIAGLFGTSVAVLSGGEAIHQRFRTIAADAQVRFDHWTRSLRMVERHNNGWVFGLGPGQFAPTYFWQPDAVDVPSRVFATSEGGDTFLRIGAGASTFVSQFVDVVSARRYFFSARVRASQSPAEFTFPLCEKWLLDSFGCVWTTVAISGPSNQWRTIHRELDTNELEYATRFTGRPVKLSLYNPNPAAYVDVTSVSLRDAESRELIANGTFSSGTDRWFFTTDSHLAWHAKSLPLHVFIELGIVGLLLFSMLIFRGMFGASRRAIDGDVFSASLLASLCGMTAVGLTDSLIDAPRIATLLYLLILIGLIVGSSQSESAARHVNERLDVVRRL